MLISTAFAQTSAGAGSDMSSLTSFLPFILMFVVLYFFMIRPQMKRQKEQKNMLAALKVGDEITTASGLMGKITGIQDHAISLEVSKGVEIKVQKSSVIALLPPNTL